MGIPIGELNQKLSGLEYAGWIDFFSRYPPLTVQLKGVQKLLAEIWASENTFFGSFGKTKQVYAAKDIAPSLFSDPIQANPKETKAERRLRIANSLRGI